MRNDLVSRLNAHLRNSLVLAVAPFIAYILNMRDDFNIDVKRTLADRVGYHCSNPACMAPTSGPQRRSAKSLNIGVASHITAASPGGPRYDPQLTRENRGGIENGIWLCQNCAKLVDNDPVRYSEACLRGWKKQSEDRSLAEIGQTRLKGRQARQSPERQVKRNIAMKKRMEKDFLRRLDRRAKWPYEKFAHSEIVIRSVDDETYPELQDLASLGAWFKVEVWDFYHNGLEVIICPEAGVVDKHGKWAVVEYGQEYDASKYEKVTLIRVGRIPWRNIVDYDLSGDKHYRCAHVYCKYADNGSPYERVAYYLINDEGYWPLESGDRHSLPSRLKRSSPVQSSIPH